MKARIMLASLLIGILATAAACGGGDDDDDDDTSTATASSEAGTKTPDGGGDDEVLTPQQIVEKLEGSVVNIEATYPEGTGGGSGIVWEDGTHILTNAHVVLGAGAIKVVDPVDSKKISARVVALSACDDVALLQVDRGNFTPAEIGDSDELEPGQEVVALGFPATYTDQGSSKLVVTRGIVSKVGDTFDGNNDLIQTDAAINPGNSGGPLVDTTGKLIGMNTFTFTGTQSQNYAISMNEAKFVAEKLKAGKNLDYIGARLQQNYQGLAEQLGIQLAYIDGIMITGVDAGSPAAKAGLGYSDLIYTVDSVSVGTVGEFCDVIRSRAAGDTLRVDITRTYSDGTFEDLYAEVVVE